jgi:hypothetical protein
MILSFILLTCYITLTDLHILTCWHPRDKSHLVILSDFFSVFFLMKKFYCHILIMQNGFHYDIFIEVYKVLSPCPPACPYLIH